MSRPASPARDADDAPAPPPPGFHWSASGRFLGWHRFGRDSAHCECRRCQFPRNAHGPEQACPERNDDGKDVPF